MTIDTFKATIHQQAPDPAWSEALKALWYDMKGDWDQSHDIAQEMAGTDGAWIHAYLHRKEGDLWNADYWYRRANRSRPEGTLEMEWEDLVLHFLKH